MQSYSSNKQLTTTINSVPDTSHSTQPQVNTLIGLGFLLLLGLMFLGSVLYRGYRRRLYQQQIQRLERMWLLPVRK